MRQIVTVAVVSAELEQSLRTKTAPEVERFLVDARARDEVAFFRCILDSWDRSDLLLMQWIDQHRPAAASVWRPLIKTNMLFVRRNAQTFLPRPSHEDISQWYNDRSLGERELQALVASLYDALEVNFGTKCTLVVTCRCLGASFDDRDYRPKS